ncbi:MAG TPA: hypothetical protein VNK24_11540 [Elusimicrobiota bacterium]|nr:hypothetical protein [Elusimicrobiota bacterium]
MKKLLGSALALAMFAAYSQAAHADTLLKNLTFNGKVDVQAVSANNVTDFNTAKYDQIGDAQTRVQLNAGWDLLDNVHAMASVVNNDSQFGNSSRSGPALANVKGQSLMGTQTGVLGNTILTQAYLKIDKLFGALDTTIGRQYYGTPGDLVVYYGPQDNIYGLAVNALDAFRFDWSNAMVGVTGIVAKTATSALGGASDAGATDLRGINVVAKGNEMYNGGAYIYNRVSHLSAAAAAPVSNDNLYVAGIRGKYMAQGATLAGEYDQNFGTNRVAGAPGSAGYDGWALKVDLGYKADLAAASVSPWAEFTDLSGGNGLNRYFTPINTDYRPGGIYGLFAGYAGASAALGGAGLGLGTSNQIGNQVIWGIGVKTTPAALSKLTAGIAYWDYRYQNVSGEKTNVGSGANTLGNTHIGSEIDLTGSWAESDNVSINGALGTFQPGGAIANLNAAASHGTNPAFLADANVSVKF